MARHLRSSLSVVLLLLQSTLGQVAEYHGMSGSFCSSEGITFDSASDNHLEIVPDITLSASITIVMRLHFTPTSHQRIMDFVTPNCSNLLEVRQNGGSSSLRISLSECSTVIASNYW